MPIPLMYYNVALYIFNLHYVVYYIIVYNDIGMLVYITIILKNINKICLQFYLQISIIFNITHIIFLYQLYPLSITVFALNTCTSIRFTLSVRFAYPLLVLFLQSLSWSPSESTLKLQSLRLSEKKVMKYSILITF